MLGIEAQCLCGGVTVRLPSPTKDVGVCHCKLCRRWGSGPWMSLQAPGASVIGDTLTVFQSSAFAERGFCRACGTHIFHRPQEGDEIAISAGLFSSDQMHIAREIFIDAKAPFYRFVADSVRRSTLSMTLEWFPKLLWRKAQRLLNGR